LELSKKKRMEVMYHPPTLHKPNEKPKQKNSTVT
jgi:hypothetical protein